MDQFDTVILIFLNHCFYFQVLCLDSSVSIFETQTLSQLGTIDTALDVDAARRGTDLIKKTSSEKSR